MQNPECTSTGSALHKTNKEQKERKDIYSKQIQLIHLHNQRERKRKRRNFKTILRARKKKS